MDEINRFLQQLYCFINRFFARFQLMGAKKVYRATGGFTLIELSIVLVIIGLIVGGVLVGQSLVSAAGVRATMTQIEKFNTAANTFYGKYGYLPGDIPAGPAAQFGLQARGANAGEGDGNGIIQGDAGSEGLGVIENAGETVVFWNDLSAAHLIEGSFTVASELQSSAVAVTLTSNPGWSSLLPQAKMGQGNYIYVWSGGTSNITTDNTNYFGISAMISEAVAQTAYINQGLTVQQAYSIDAKIDDGLPQSGNVTAMGLGSFQSFGEWAAGGGGFGASSISNGPTTNATAGSATTCYDNGGVAGTQKYSLEISNGANVNCSLSFRMQTGSR